MQVNTAFTVTAPLEEVWTALMDFERVAGCVPGAQVLNKLSEDAYQVGMTVKLGPVTMQYRGQMEVVERDPAGHRAVIRGTAKEARGQGTAAALVQLQLSEDGGATRGTVVADMTITGRAAAMAQGVIGTVSEQMMGQFATNLQALLAAGGPAPVLVAVPDPDPDPVTDAAPAPVSAPVPAPAPTPTPAPASAPAPVDGLALARGVAAAQLREPRTVLLLLAAVAAVAYRGGRRSTRRQHAAWTEELLRAAGALQTR